MNYYYIIESKNHTTCVCVYMHEKKYKFNIQKESIKSGIKKCHMNRKKKENIF